LSSGRGLDPAHPAFHGWARPVVFTSREGQARLQDSGLDVVATDAPSARAAIAWLRGEGARCVSIEAGPSTSRPLYDEPPVVDELLLSLFLGDAPPDPVIGEELLPLSRVQELFADAAAPVDVDEPSGRWRFQRFRRAPVR
jgi:hypothetical protein